MSKRKKNVQKKVRKRSLKHFFSVLFGVIMALAILGLAAFLVISIFFNVKKVSYEGSTIYSDAQLAEMIFTDKYSGNSIYCWGKNKIQPVEGIPFVDSVKIELVNPNTIKVKIKEKEKICRMMDVDGNQVYFDSDNVVTEVSDMVFDQVPEVTMEDVELKKLNCGDKLPFKTKRDNELKNLVFQLKEQQIAVQSMHFSSEGSIYLAYNGITVNFGTSANTDAKILRLKYILPQLEGQSGTLHLEDWTEGNRDIVFEKNE